MPPSARRDEAARAGFYATLARLAALIASQGLVVIVAATASRRAFRDEARALAPRFVEVFVDVPASACVARDAKGLYAAEREGRAHDLPGADAIYEGPTRPDVVASGGLDEAAVHAVLAQLDESAPRA